MSTLTKQNFSKIVATLGVAASFAVLGATTASADSVTVKSGDTLNKIAEAHNTDADTLAALNHIQNKNLIYVGDTIQLDSNSSTSEPVVATAPATTTATTTYAPTTQYSAPAPKATPAPASNVGNSSALNALINRESGGNTSASNGQYYGIGQLSPQARAMYGGNSSDYNDQLNAMKSYIAARYGTAENAWAHSQATGWY